MDEILKAAILGVVEGLTEFLPVSSTGHLIIASDLLNFQALGGTFEIFIQIGAVLAVVWYYRAELLRQVRTVGSDPAVRHLWATLILASIPAGIFGFLLRGWVKETLFTPVVAAVALALLDTGSQLPPAHTALSAPRPTNATHCTLRDASSLSRVGTQAGVGRLALGDLPGKMHEHADVRRAEILPLRRHVLAVGNCVRSAGRSRRVASP